MDEYQRDKDSGLLAHISESGGPHGGHEHGRRGSGTWSDGTSQTSEIYNQGGKRTFADGTPVTSKNHADFIKNPSAPPRKRETIGQRNKRIQNLIDNM